jgi:hypothetical protein
MNKLPHEIREMLDQCEEVADFLQWCVTGEVEGATGIVLMDSHGNPWPLDVGEFRKWEQSIRNLKQMVRHAN